MLRFRVSAFSSYAFYSVNWLYTIHEWIFDAQYLRFWFMLVLITSKAAFLDLDEPEGASDTQVELYASVNETMCSQIVVALASQPFWARRASISLGLSTTWSRLPSWIRRAAINCCLWCGDHISSRLTRQGCRTKGKPTPKKGKTNRHMYSEYASTLM